MQYGGEKCQHTHNAALFHGIDSWNRPEGLEEANVKLYLFSFTSIHPKIILLLIPEY